MKASTIERTAPNTPTASPEGQTGNAGEPLANQGAADLAEQAGSEGRVKAAPKSITVCGVFIGTDDSGRLFSQHDAEQAARVWSVLNPVAIDREQKRQGLGLTLPGVADLQAAMLKSAAFQIKIGAASITPRDLVLKAPTRVEVLKALRVAE